MLGKSKKKIWGEGNVSAKSEEIKRKKNKE